MSRPTRALKQPLIQSFADWDRVGQISDVLRQFEAGYFHSAAMLWDAMLRDDRCNGVISTRIGGLMSAPMVVHAATDKRKPKKIAEEIGGKDGEGGSWDDMFPQAAVGEMLRWGYGVGIAVAENVWATDNGAWTPRIRVWHPQFIRWDTNKCRYVIRTGEGGEVDLPNTDEERRSDGRWVIWTPYGYNQGWMRALVRPLATLFLSRQWNFRDWSRYNEVHGLPVRVAEVPSSATPEEEDAFFIEVMNAGSDGVVKATKDENGKGFDYRLVEATGRTYDTFKLQMEELNTDIAIAVLGQNLTTEVTGGSFAAASMHDKVRIDKQREDAAIASVFRAQVLTWWAEYNYGDPKLAPRPVYQVDPAEDDVAEATAIKLWGEAAQAHALAGTRIDMDAVLERAGVPLLPLEEIDVDADVIAEVSVDEKAPALELTPTAVSAVIKVNEARAAMGYGPLLLDDGSPDPDGRLSVAEYQAKYSSVVAEAVNAESGGEEAPQGAKLKPAALRQTLSGKRRAARYADTLIDRAKQRATKAMQPDLTALMAAINGAESFDDVKTRVQAAFKGMDPKALATIVERAGIMASLVGRKELLEKL